MPYSYLYDDLADMENNKKIVLGNMNKAKEALLTWHRENEIQKEPLELMYDGIAKRPATQ